MDLAIAGTKKATPSSSKRAESEVKRPATSTNPSKSAKRSSSQPAIKDVAMLEPELEDCVTLYAFQTRTGFIPQKDDKQNQDQYFIVQNFGNITNNWLFGVCDGHGINGHFASDHVKQFLPTNIELLDYMLLKQKEKEALTPAEERKDQEWNFFSDDEKVSSYLLSQDRRKKYTVINEGFIKTA